MKNRFFKPLTSLVLAILMVATLLPAMVVGTFAADAYTGTGTFTQATGTLTSGYYVFGVGDNAGSIAAVSTTTGSNNWILFETTTSTSGTITDPATSIVWYYDAEAGTFNNGTNYVAWPTTGNSAALKTTGTPLTVTETATAGVYNITVTATSGRMLRLNGTSGYRFYSSGTGKNPFYFFKLEEAKHEHSYAWNNVEGTDGSHTLACANTDGKCDATTKTEACTWEDGYCSVCGAAAPECAHPTTTNVAEVPATCTEGGYTAGVQCTVCNQYTSGHEEIAALGHTVEIDAAVAAGCTTTGLTEGKHCSVCEEVLVAQTVVDALGHNYENGTCTECSESVPLTYTFDYTTGYENQTQISGEKEGLVTLVYSKASGSTNPTWYENGTALRFYKNNNLKISTVEGYYIKSVTLKITQGSLSADTGSLESGVWTPADNKTTTVIFTPSETTRVQGITIELATICKHTNTVAIGEAKDATCTEDGITAGEKCADCGEVIAEQQTIPATGHNFVGGVCTNEGCGEIECDHIDKDITLGEITKSPSCIETGLQEQFCAQCGQPLEDKVLDKVAHTPEIDAAVDATCTETGLTEGSHCSVCGETLVAQTEVPMAAHNYVDNKCTVCGDIIVTGDKLAGFEFGENGESAEGTAAIKPGVIETDGAYELNFTTADKIYDKTWDALGNSAIKLGTSSAAGVLEFTVPANVNTVVIYIAGRQTANAKITVNGESYTITTHSNDGEYTKIVVDTTTTKTVNLTTVSGGYRALINSIEFWGEAVPVNTQYSITLGGDIGVNVYYFIPDAWLAANPDAMLNINGTLYDLKAGENAYTYRVAPTHLDTVITYFIVGDDANSATVSVNGYIAEAKVAFADNAELVALLTAIETYGAAAKDYLAAPNGTADRATAPDLSAIADTVKTGETFASVSAVLDSMTTLRIYFAEETDLSGYTYTLTVDGKTIVTDEDLAAAVSGNVFNIKNIPAHMLDAAVELSITKDGATETVTTSVMSYVKSAIGTDVSDTLYNLLVAIATYNQAANAYFGA